MNGFMFEYIYVFRSIENIFTFLDLKKKKLIDKLFNYSEIFLKMCDQERIFVFISVF